MFIYIIADIRSDPWLVLWRLLQDSMVVALETYRRISNARSPRGLKFKREHPKCLHMPFLILEDQSNIDYLQESKMFLDGTKKSL